ncbi:MAG TPA: GNAT family N-acetyltransferase [Actinomycetota bacterium]|jgi:RimJ/RimL family protein N-acetyltransferase
MATIVETQRLRLREFARSDLDVLAEMVGDEEQVRFYPRPKTRDEAAAWIDRNLRFYETLGFGFWLVESLSSSAFLGYCGIRPVELGGAPEVELGWHTKKTVWKRGIATEAATAAVRLAFDRFALSRLVARIHPDHRASRRVAEKLGMTAGATMIHDDYPFVVYEIEASQPPRT